MLKKMGVQENGIKTALNGMRKNMERGTSRFIGMRAPFSFPPQHTKNLPTAPPDAQHL